MKFTKSDLERHNDMVNPKPSYFTKHPKTVIVLCGISLMMVLSAASYEAPIAMTDSEKSAILKHNAEVCNKVNLSYLPYDFKDITKGSCVSDFEYTRALRKAEREIVNSMLK